ncbi:hypothetical protein [Cellulomonas palmilytica]|uniref:hypothetical protein n=1 Tax=Cellulomonas palmilytica TaxID=2608402 RepID=UPI001F2AA3A8|nr:hypothetical protein [Cellulomonas palmilytica]UJP39432.1 hypothetical protein F1D97_14030 [Cellulomonas palmilytica]
MGHDANREPDDGRGPDGEQVHGLLSLVGVVLALVVGPVLWWWTDVTPPAAVLLTLVALVGAVTLASTNWRRASLRLVAALGVAILALMLVDVGRDVRAAQSLDEARSELGALRSAADSLESTVRETEESRAAALAKRVSALRTLAQEARGSDVGVGALADRADEVADAIEADDDERVASASARFARAVPASAAPVVVELQEAIEGAVGAFGSRSDASTANAQVEAALTRADAATGNQAGAAGEVDGAAVAVAVVRLRLAELRAELFGRPEDDTAVAEATDALTAALAATPRWAPQEVTVGTAFSAGARDVLVGGSSDPSDVRLVPEPATWVLLGLAALLFWRWVEKRSARQLPGPVRPTLTPYTPKDGGPDTADDQKAVFRAALLRNISEPAAVPGATALQSLTDLAELAPTGPTSWITRVATAVSHVLQAPVGYDVTAEVAPPAGGSTTGRFRVLVRISDRAGSRSDTVASVVGTTAVGACRTAGYWAAAAVLARSSRVPRWARWTPESARSLAAYDSANDVDAADSTWEELARAVAAAPDSGVLLHQWADWCDLHGRHLEALGLYARAVAAHPRFPAARYRLAVSLTMLASATRAGGGWCAGSADERARTVAQLRRACRGMGLGPQVDDHLVTLTAAEATEASTASGAVAGALFDHLRTSTRWWRIPWSGLRRSERDVFWPPGWEKLGERGAWSRARWVARSGALTHMARAGSSDLERERDAAITVARRRGSFWQLSYNVACSYALELAEQSARARNGGRPLSYDELVNRDRALEWLETVLERPGSTQMALDWLRADPDLASVRDHPRFAWVCAQVDDDEEA